MNIENQNIEYKESWRDEYLKWVCGFANAQGGRLYIGIDDKGNVCGVENAHRLSQNKGVSDTISNKMSNKEFERVGNNIAETTQKIIELVRNYPEITTEELAEKCGVTKDGIKWQLKKLKSQSIIRRVGPDKGGHWEIIKEK